MRITAYDEFQKSFQETLSKMGEGYVVAMLSDCFVVRRIGQELPSAEELFHKALEIRAFNRMEETKWFRGDLGTQDFACRTIWDDNLVLGKESTEYWDETHYLDIDEQKSDSSLGIAVATGGGKYELPLEKYGDVKIRIRNYLVYDEDTSQLGIADWRLVDFEEEERGEDNA